MLKESKKDLINILRQEGKTFQEIGNELGISRQRVHQIWSGYKIPPKPYIILENIFGLNENDKNKYDNKGIRKLESRDFLREIVRKRDNYTCQKCGRVWQEKQRRLDVHHLDEKLEGENGRKWCNNLNFDRMITLCHKCHLNLPHIREKMRKGHLSTY